jgi:hypothetical protein
MIYKQDQDHNDNHPTTRMYVPKVCVRSPCEVHEAIDGDPCFLFPSTISDRMIEGICNQRARNAGMTHQINLSSLVRTVNKEPNVKYGRNKQTAQSS